MVSLISISMDELIRNVNSICFQDAERVLRYLSKHSEYLCRAAEAVVDDRGSELSYIIHAITGDSQYSVALAVFLKTQANASINLERTSFLSDALVYFRQLYRCRFETIISADSELSSFFHAAIFEISCKVMELSRRNGCAKAVVGPLIRLFKTMTSQPEKLTSMHAILMEMVICADMLSFGAKLIAEFSVHEINHELCFRAGFDVVSYLYYGAYCCVGVRQYADALSLLVDAIALPTTVLSVVIIAAIKKAKLVSLLVDPTKPFEVPKCTSPCVQRYFHVPSPGYDLFCSRVVADDYYGVFASINDEIFIQELKYDGNYGLVKKLGTTILEKRLEGVVSVFNRMSLKDVSLLCMYDTSLTLLDVEIMLLRLLDSKAIFGAMNQKKCVIDFRGRIDWDVSPQIVFRQLLESIKVDDRIRKRHHDIMQNSAYVIKKVQVSAREEGVNDVTAYSDGEIEDDTASLPMDVSF